MKTRKPSFRRCSISEGPAVMPQGTPNSLQAESTDWIAFSTAARSPSYARRRSPGPGNTMSTPGVDTISRAFATPLRSSMMRMPGAFPPPLPERAHGDSRPGRDPRCEGRPRRRRRRRGEGASAPSLHRVPLESGKARRDRSRAERGHEIAHSVHVEGPGLHVVENEIELIVSGQFRGALPRLLGERAEDRFSGSEQRQEGVFPRRRLRIGRNSQENRSGEKEKEERRRSHLDRRRLPIEARRKQDTRRFVINFDSNSMPRRVTPQLSGWGRIPVPAREAFSEDLRKLTEDAVLSRGLGRSYGDSSLPPPSRIEVASTVLADRILEFDETTGVLRAEAGLSLRDLIRGVPPPKLVSPGEPRNRVRHPGRNGRRRRARQEPPRRGNVRGARGRAPAPRRRWPHRSMLARRPSPISSGRRSAGWD